MILCKESVVLLVIDFQSRLFPYIGDNEIILQNILKLVKSAQIFRIPIVRTEQKKLGKTIPALEFKGKAIESIEKETFSCCGEKVFNERLKDLKKSVCLITGIETHICVLQTTIDLLNRGYRVQIAVDCTGSRNNVDRETALLRLARLGVVLTTAETAIYELLGSADRDEFKSILSIIKGQD